MNPEQEAQARAFIDSLPPMLSDDEIVRICAESAARSKGAETYRYAGLCFEVPEHVHVPGATSRTIHDKLVDASIALKDKCYIVMGVGCGVEPVIAATKQAREVYAVDIDEMSIRATHRNFARLAATFSNTRLHTYVSDLLMELPDDIRADLITFTPPTVQVPISEDPDIVRAICAGPDVMRRLFSQMREKAALADDGQLIITVSNSSDLRNIVGSGVEQGFSPSILAVHRWPVPYERLKTHVFCFQWAGS